MFHCFLLIFPGYQHQVSCQELRSSVPREVTISVPEDMSWSRAQVAPVPVLTFLFIQIILRRLHFLWQPTQHLTFTMQISINLSRILGLFLSPLTSGYPYTSPIKRTPFPNQRSLLDGNHNYGYAAFG